MVYNSGRDLNDLGRYDACNDLNFTRYIVFNTYGLPMGVFLGICGPRECTVDNYNSVRPFLAEYGNKIIASLNIDAKLFDVNLTESNFLFVDSLLKNTEIKSMNVPTALAILFFGIFGVLCLIGTGVEIWNNFQENK